ncbi:MAG: MBL fold metallo-hydrolase [Thermoanaerobaculia bacterium]|nr:MBL fold metallo-hydrolase [Thermoanaerobaculia bacterium]
MRRDLAATALAACAVVALTACSGSGAAPPAAAGVVSGGSGAVLSPAQIVAGARRIPTAAGWFEIVALPNDVYALWEPGHAEKVNAFFIVGTARDVLYDTGMGIASIAAAILDLKRAEGLPERELMVVNSHNHLDHNGGNGDFDEAWIIEDDWGIAKLVEGIPPGGPDGAFVAYWAQLTPYPGVRPPADFDPGTFSIPPFPRDRIRFLHDGDVVDLGNRSFRVIHTTAHSPDGLALYDEENRILFGGDTFIGDQFLIRTLELLARDLERASRLEVDYHYSSHGRQLIDVMQSGRHLGVVRRMIAGERQEGETVFAGATLPLYSLDGVDVIVAGDFLTY